MTSMLFINMVIIIILKETYAYISQDIETILLPALKPTGAEEVRVPLRIALFIVQRSLFIVREL